jgi:phosphohistidine phosphatase SixA
VRNSPGCSRLSAATPAVYEPDDNRIDSEHRFVHGGDRHEPIQGYVGFRLSGTVRKGKLGMNGRIRRRHTTWFLSLLIFSGLLITTSSAEVLQDGALLSALRHGGYVLVMRHASAPRTPPDRDSARPDNINVERELDKKGRDTARTMGAAIKRLGIPIGEIESSATYRALETLAFAGLPESRKVTELGDDGQSMAPDTQGSRAKWLQRRVTQSPRPDTNTLLVTQQPNIQEAFGHDADDLADGETLVFQPVGKESATLVARIKIQDWPHLDRKTP